MRFCLRGLFRQSRKPLLPFTQVLLQRINCLFLFPDAAFPVQRLQPLLCALISILGLFCLTVRIFQREKLFTQGVRFRRERFKLPSFLLQGFARCICGVGCGAPVCLQPREIVIAGELFVNGSDLRGNGADLL